VIVTGASDRTVGSICADARMAQAMTLAAQIGFICRGEASAIMLARADEQREV